MVLVVGLAVDYTVHFAEGYSRSARVDRKGRTRDALTEVRIKTLSTSLKYSGHNCNNHPSSCVERSWTGHRKRYIVIKLKTDGGHF